MKPRERVLLALNHKEPDKVPIDLGANNISSMVTGACQNIREHLGMLPDPDPEISHNRQDTVYPMPDLFEHYQVDFRPVTMKKAPRWVATKTLPGGDWYDEFNNPVQYSAAHMDLSRLKNQFGQDLCFWGGIDVQQALFNASLDGIEGEVQRDIEMMAPGGGYAFAPTYNIQPDAPPDRLDRVYETALKFHQYPIAVEGE